MENKETDKAGNYPPGWNDPPMLSYSPSNPPPKSRIGNKRVAFPLAGTANASPATDKPSGLPPMPPSAISETKIPSEKKEQVKTSEELFQTTVDNLDKLLTNVDNDDVKKRLDVMKTMWQDSKFDNNVQVLICDLLSYLVNGDKSKANEIQLKLMMEAAPVCSSWMTAVRFLINNS